MAFYSGSKSNQNLVFGNKGEIRTNSFTYSSAPTANTVNKITPSDGAAENDFGRSVAIGSNKIVVGAPYIGLGQDSGSAYIYDLDGTNQIKITPSDGAAGDRFGASVAVGNNKIVVGSHQDDDNGNSSGSAYIYDLDGTNEIKLTPSDGAAGDRFGLSVAVGNNKIVVGAASDDNVNGSGAGAVYIYDLDGTNEIKITAFDGAANDYFGESVAIGNNRIVVGATNDDDNGSSTGSAYIYDLDGNHIAKLQSTIPVQFGAFGDNVAIGNGRIVVGAQGPNPYIFDLYGNQITQVSLDSISYIVSCSVNSNRIIIGHSGDNDIQQSSGAIYIYDLNGNRIEKIKSYDASSYDLFGESVAIGNGRIVVGAPNDDDNGYNSGSVYIYNTNEYYEDYIEKTLELIG